MRWRVEKGGEFPVPQETPASFSRTGNDYEGRTMERRHDNTTKVMGDGNGEFTDKERCAAQNSLTTIGCGGRRLTYCTESVTEELRRLRTVSRVQG